jgi:hypothetical protein
VELPALLPPLRRHPNTHCNHPFRRHDNFLMTSRITPGEIVPGRVTTALCLPQGHVQTSWSPLPGRSPQPARRNARATSRYFIGFTTPPVYPPYTRCATRKHCRLERTPA